MLNFQDFATHFGNNLPEASKPRSQRSRTNPEEKYQDLVFRFIVTPFIILLGIFFIGAVIETLFGIPKVTAYLFSSIGGIGLAVVYFQREIKSVMNKN